MPALMTAADRGPDDRGPPVRIDVRRLPACISHFYFRFQIENEGSKRIKCVNGFGETISSSIEMPVLPRWYYN
jgi:hypothetical protein